MIFPLIWITFNNTVIYTHIKQNKKKTAWSVSVILNTTLRYDHVTENDSQEVDIVRNNTELKGKNY